MLTQASNHLAQIINAYHASNDPIPYEAQHVIGDGNFRAIGAEFLTYLVGIGGLSPQNDVLDIGCGFGRIALPLARFLTPKSHYLGFDIVAEPIDWCRQHVAPLHPGFVFKHIDLKHPLYNTAGVSSSDLGFKAHLPDLAAQQTDFALAVSVFTHLDQPSIEQYLADLGAILRPGGRVFMTAFLTGAGAPPASAGCVFPTRNWRAHGPLQALLGTPLTAAVGISMDWLQQVIAASGLLLLQVHFGHWRWGRDFGGSFQDILVCVKPHDA